MGGQKASLLVNVTVAGTPPEYLVITSRTVYCWLRVDGQEAILIHLGKLLRDDGCFCSETLIGPRKCS